MAREADEIYLENSFDIFKVINLVETIPYHEYTVEVYRLIQKVKFSPSVGETRGYDFLFHGVRFFQYVTTNSDCLLKDKSFIDRMFEQSFKNALAIR